MKGRAWHYLESAEGADIQSLFDDWKESHSDFWVLAFVSEKDAESVGLLQTAANTMDIPLVGTIVPGLITNEGIKHNGVLLLVLDGGIQKTIVSLPHHGYETDDSVVSELASFVEKNSNVSGVDTLLLLIDAMTPDIGSLLDRLYLAVGNRVRYAGSNVGSETFEPIACLFDNTDLFRNAALAVLLPHHPGASLAHSYSNAVPLGISTSSNENSIAAINGLPAFEIYQHLAASNLGIQLTRKNFYEYAVYFPLAQQMVEGEPLVRIPVTIDEEGRVYCLGNVRESSMLIIVKAPDPQSLDTVYAVARQMLHQDTPAICVFYCAGRLQHHGEAASAHELAKLRKEVGIDSLFGILSLGEIANYQGSGYPRFHNATITALPWY